MTQLQTRETTQTPSEPVSPQEQGSKWTAFVVGGVLALLAAAFGLALWANSNAEPETTTDFGASSDSVEIVQNEIDKALAATGTETSSVEIVQNEIDKALAQAETELSASEIEQAVESRQVRFSEDSVDPVANYGSEGGLDAASFGGE